jgi:pyruvate formate lyase activating enzyme
MTAIHEARFWEQHDGRVKCTLCPHDCKVHDGGRGACAVRYAENGKLWTLVYDKVVARHVEPIEKKPFFHLMPGSWAYSVGTVGCNLRCAFCQNWEISQWPKENLPASESEVPQALMCPTLTTFEHSIPGEPITPDEIVVGALASGAKSIAYTYTEPTVFYELAYDTAVLAREKGLKNLFVTNGFISEAPLRQLAKVLDGANVDLKFFRDESYRKISRCSLEPILRAIRLYKELGVWVEVTTLVVPGLNDSDEELRDIAEFVASVGRDVPWHVSQYYPAYKMRDRPVTPVETLRRAADIGRAAGLRWVYEGNVPGERGECTSCWKCGATLIERYGFHVRANRVRDAACPDCGAKVDGVSMDGGTREVAIALQP